MKRIVFLVVFFVGAISCQKEEEIHADDMLFSLQGGSKTEVIEGISSRWMKTNPDLPPLHITGIRIIGESKFYMNDAGEEIMRAESESRFAIDGIEAKITPDAKLTITVAPSDTARAWRVYYEEWNQYSILVEQY